MNPLKTPSARLTARADLELLPHVISATQAAGLVLARRFPASATPTNHGEILDALEANDRSVLAVLRDDLLTARPGSGWVEDEGGTGSLPPGEWWVTDPAEGNINHIHGLDDWAVSATLVRGNRPVLAVIHQPHRDRTYTAVRGAGAWLNEEPLTVSAKTELGDALVGTGQAVPGEDASTHRTMGRTVTAMLGAALVIKVAVPATLHLLDLAAGRTDVFWQHSRVRSGLLAGALLVSEAGGTVSDLRGAPWTLDSADFLASVPALHEASLLVLTDPDDSSEDAA